MLNIKQLTCPVMAKIFVALWLQATQIYALKCYTSSHDGRMVTLEEDPSWKYCVYAESLYTYTTESKPPVHVSSSRPAYFGFGDAAEDLTATDSVFDGSDPEMYTVISNCVLEKFVGPAGSPSASSPEYVFRCMCAEDKCNKGSNFRHFRNHNVRQHIDV